MQFLQVKEIQELSPNQSGTLSLPAKFSATACKNVFENTRGFPVSEQSLSSQRVVNQELVYPAFWTTICRFQRYSLSKYLTFARK